MASVKFIPGGVSIEIEEGTTILDAARRAGIIIESPCNGTGKCGKCKVRLARDTLQSVIPCGGPGPKDDGEGLVLACSTGVKGEISVELVQDSQKESLKILSHGKGFAASHDPRFKKVYSLREDATKVYAGCSLLCTENGNTEGSNYGIVVDIGTTTLVLSLVDLNSGKEIAATSALNPQSLHAQDVLSRITLASREEGLETLHREFVGETNRMIKTVLAQTGVKKENIYEAVYSGNTCMLHLATKTNPASLGKFPYDPAISGNELLSAGAHRLHISPLGSIYLPPIISGFVGADITSGVLATRLHEQKGATLFVDIGTNGEMVLAVEGKLTASSTAAGPAFEGMNITFGMRAGNGAMERFEVHGNGTLSMATIGDGALTGICGSGLIDLIGELVAGGAIQPSGRLADPVRSNGISPILKERLRKKDGKQVFFLTPEVYLSQKDVRQVQLAKGAIRTGIEFLLSQAGMDAGKVDRVLIAGSFGYHLREQSLINIGLLPAEFSGKIDFVGNTSKSGGHVFLTSQGYRDKMKRITADVDVLELANYKDFDRVFMRNMGF